MRFIQKWGIVFTFLLSAILPAQAESSPVATPQISLYGLQLDQPLELPICDEKMYWYAQGSEPCMWFVHEDTMQAKPVWRLLSRVGAMIYPTQMQEAQNLPDSITIGLDQSGVLAYVMMSPKGIAVQGDMVEIVSEQLGKPAAMAIRDDNDDPFKAPPDGISLEMWFSADPGAIVAEWQTDYAWARYVGQLPGSTDGYLEIGLKRITRRGQLPEW